MSDLNVAQEKQFIHIASFMPFIHTCIITDRFRHGLTFDETPMNDLKFAQ